MRMTKHGKRFVSKFMFGVFFSPPFFINFFAISLLFSFFLAELFINIIAIFVFYIINY